MVSRSSISRIGNSQKQKQNDASLLILVLTGPATTSTPATATQASSMPTLKRYEEASGKIRLQLSAPPTVGADEANLIAALIFEQLDQEQQHQQQQQQSDVVVVDRVKVSSVRFTAAGAATLREFLSVHAPTVTHLSLKNIPQQEHLVTVAQAFTAAQQLQVVNLSDNTLPAAVWTCLSSSFEQNKLRQLLLDQVGMDDTSLTALAHTMGNSSASLQDIYVVLRGRAYNDATTEAIQSWLRRCTHITSFRWAFCGSAGGSMPWQGLRQMVFHKPAASTLRHLVMDGPAATLTVQDLGDEGLCGALQQLHELRTLKLRDIGLVDSGVRSIMLSLRVARPALQWLDMSGNAIEADGARAIAEVLPESGILAHLQVLSVERNKISTDGGSYLLETLCTKVSPEFDLRLNDNPMNYGRIAVALACAACRRKETGPAESAEIRRLQEEVEQLRNEKQTLKEAFAILGVGQQITENRRLIDRVSSLEASTSSRDCSFSSIPSGGSCKISKSMPTVCDTPTSATMPIELTTPSTSSRASTLSSLSSGHYRNLPLTPCVAMPGRDERPVSKAPGEHYASVSSNLTPSSIKQKKNLLFDEGENSNNSDSEETAGLEKVKNTRAERNLHVYRMRRHSVSQPSAAMRPRFSRSNSAATNTFCSSSSSSHLNAKEEVAKLAAASNKMRRPMMRKQSSRRLSHYRKSRSLLNLTSSPEKSEDDSF